LNTNKIGLNEDTHNFKKVSYSDSKIKNLYKRNLTPLKSTSNYNQNNFSGSNKNNNLKSKSLKDKNKNENINLINNPFKSTDESSIIDEDMMRIYNENGLNEWRKFKEQTMRDQLEDSTDQYTTNID